MCMLSWNAGTHVCVCVYLYTAFFLYVSFDQVPFLGMACSWRSDARHIVLGRLRERMREGGRERQREREGGREWERERARERERERERAEEREKESERVRERARERKKERERVKQLLIAHCTRQVVSTADKLVVWLKKLYGMHIYTCMQHTPYIIYLSPALCYHTHTYSLSLSLSLSLTHTNTGTHTHTPHTRTHTHTHTLTHTYTHTHTRTQGPFNRCRHGPPSSCCFCCAVWKALARRGLGRMRQYYRYLLTWFVVVWHDLDSFISVTHSFICVTFICICTFIYTYIHTYIYTCKYVWDLPSTDCCILVVSSVWMRVHVPCVYICVFFNIDRAWTHCTTLQHTATHCNTPRRTASRSQKSRPGLWNQQPPWSYLFSNKMSHVWMSHITHTHSNCWKSQVKLVNSEQHTATHGNIRQHTATHSQKVRPSSWIRKSSWSRSCCNKMSKLSIVSWNIWCFRSVSSVYCICMCMSKCACVSMYMSMGVCICL